MYQLSKAYFPACFPDLVFAQPFFSLATFALCIDWKFSKQSRPGFFSCNSLSFSLSLYLLTTHLIGKMKPEGISTLCLEISLDRLPNSLGTFFLLSKLLQTTVLSFCHYIISISFLSLSSNIYLVSLQVFTIQLYQRP